VGQAPLRRARGAASGGGGRGGRRAAAAVGSGQVSRRVFLVHRLFVVGLGSLGAVGGWEAGDALHAAMDGRGEWRSFTLGAVARRPHDVSSRTRPAGSGAPAPRMSGVLSHGPGPLDWFPHYGRPCTTSPPALPPQTIWAGPCTHNNYRIAQAKARGGAADTHTTAAGECPENTPPQRARTVSGPPLNKTQTNTHTHTHTHKHIDSRAGPHPLPRL